MSTQPIPQPDNFQYIKLPDGSYGKFAADASDDVIRAAIQKDFPDSLPPNSGLAAPAQPSQMQPLTDVRARLGAILNSPASQFAGTLATGAAKSFAQHALNDPVGVTAFGMPSTPAGAVPGAAQSVELNGVGEHIGGIAEQTGEMLASGGPLRKGATMLPQVFQRGGRIAAESLNAILNAAAHNQDLKTAAVAGASGGVLSELSGPLSRGIIKDAIGANAKSAAAILEDTTGITPKQISGQAAIKSLALTRQLEQMASASTAPASTSPAIAVIDREMTKASQENALDYYNKLQSLRSQLTTDFSTGQPIPSSVSASKILDLKRGIGKTIKGFDPQTRDLVKGIKQQVYGALDSELDKTVPGAADINDQISALLGAKQAAAKTAARGIPGLSTGLLKHGAGAAIGGFEGYQHGGPGGALAGVATGYALASPSARVALGRILASPIPRAAGEAATLQANQNPIPEDMKAHLLQLLGQQ